MEIDVCPQCGRPAFETSKIATRYARQRRPAAPVKVYWCRRSRRCFWHIGVRPPMEVVSRQVRKRLFGEVWCGSTLLRRPASHRSAARRPKGRAA